MKIRASLLCLPLFSLALAPGRTALADTPAAARSGTQPAVPSPGASRETPPGVAPASPAAPSTGESKPVESAPPPPAAEPAPSSAPGTAEPPAEPPPSSSTEAASPAPNPEAPPAEVVLLATPPQSPARVAEAPAAEPSRVVPKGNEGHFVLGGSVGFTAPFGELAQRIEAFPTIDMGFAAALDAGYGLGEHLVVGAQGELDFHGDASECEDCSARSIFAGAFARYHLVSHLRFDPWVSYGLGFRTLGIETGAGASQSFHGLEWLRIQFGGDFYLTKTIGFGPVVQLSAMSFLKSPYDDGTLDDPKTGGVNWRFSTGFRFVLDHPGH